MSGRDAQKEGLKEIDAAIAIFLDYKDDAHLAEALMTKGREEAAKLNAFVRFSNLLIHVLFRNLTRTHAPSPFGQVFFPRVEVPSSKSFTIE